MISNSHVHVTIPTSTTQPSDSPFLQFRDRFRYWWRLRFQPRQNHIYSKFNRFPTQLDVLATQVLPLVLAIRKPTIDAPLEIAVFACCGGEEAYTLAYTLATRAPEIPVRIRAYDIVSELVAQAKAGSYARDQVRSSPFMNDELVTGMFDSQGERLTVKPRFASMVTFETGDITNTAAMARLPRADLSFAQNVLFHLPRPTARRAFRNLVSGLNAGGALFVNGMDMDMRLRLTRQYGLDPVAEGVAQVHEEARLDRGAAWASNYWGREPLKAKGDWLRKYGTIFVKR